MIRLVLLVIITMVTAACGQDRGTSAAPSSAIYDVWEWNVAGSTIHGGSVSDGLVEASVESIVRRRVEFAAFNELCWQQYQALATQLLAAGWPQDPSNFSRFAEQQSGSASVCAGQPFGVALFSALPLGPAEARPLPPDGSDQRRQLLCAPLRDESGVRFCTTHITTSGDLSSSNGLPHNVNQLNAVLKQLEAYRADGATVVIAGDFNAQPSYRRLDNWYSSGLDVPANQDNAGSYRELDDNDSAHCRGFGEWTAAGPPGALPPCAGSESTCTVAAADGCGKIDLIFVREDRIVGDYTSDSLAISSSCDRARDRDRDRSEEYSAGSCSDHRIVTGTVRVLTGPYEPSREALSGPALNSPWSTPGAARRTRSRRSARPRRAVTPARAARGASGCR
jgi:endonuclease/exonuclease/phosphatase family metal-dependent hydrolase